MIRHIVMWKLQDQAAGQSKEANGQAVRQALMALPAKIDEIAGFEVGLNINGSERAGDVVLVSTFKDQEALKTYSAHPDHQEVVRFIRTVSAETRVVDYVTDDPPL